MCLRPMLYPSDGELLDEGMQVWANLTTCRHSERKEGVGSGERAPILVFLPLDSVGEVFSYVACCVPEIGADARVDDGDVEEKSLILESRVVVEECPCLRCDVHT